MKTLHTWSFVLSLVSAGFASGVSAAVEVARVDGKVITLEEFNKKYQAMLPFYANKTPTRATVLDDIVKREYAASEARRQKLDQDPEVQDEITAVLYQALLRKALANDVEKIQITDSDAKAYYAKNPEIRTSHIFVSVPLGATKEEEASAHKQIKEIQDKELKGNRSFAEVAQKFSEGVAAPLGGDIGYQPRSQLDSNYYEAALALKTPGKNSGIVRSQYGYHIIRLTAIRPWAEVDPAAVKQQIFNERKQALTERYLASIRSKHQIQVKPEAVR